MMQRKLYYETEPRRRCIATAFCRYRDILSIVFNQHALDDHRKAVGERPMAAHGILK
jgi:hypothetical protein